MRAKLKKAVCNRFLISFKDEVTERRWAQIADLDRWSLLSDGVPRKDTGSMAWVS